MTPLDWLTLAGLCFLGASSPGPSLLVVVTQVVQGGRKHGLLAALAHGCGVGVYALLAAFGLALLLQQVPGLFDALRWLGAGFLLYLAWLALTRPVSFRVSAGDAPVPRTRGALVSGFLVAFLNPKLALFFLAVYTQFLQPHSPVGQKLGMALLSALVDALWYLLVALLVSHPAVMQRLQRQAVVLQRVFGVLLLLVAIRVLM